MAKTAPAPQRRPAPASPRPAPVAAAPAKRPAPPRAAPTRAPQAPAPVASATGTDEVGAILDELNEFWGSAEDQSFGEVPDDKYQVKILSAKINRSKASARKQCSWDMEILAPDEYRGRHLFKHDGMDNEDSLGWFRTGLARLGVEWPSSPTELPDVLSGLIDTYAEVRCKTKEGSSIQNIHFNRALDEADLDAPAEATEDTVAGVEPGGPQGAEPEEDPAEAGEAAEAGEGLVGAAERGEVTFKFNDKHLNPAQTTWVKETGELYGFETSAYTATTDLLGDLAEHLGISGDFAKPSALIAAVEAASNELNPPAEEAPAEEPPAPAPRRRAAAKA